MRPKSALIPLIAFAVTGVAHAQLVELDDPVFGAGALTHDLAQDVYFLDPVHTLGLSYNDILPELEPGGTYGDFRHATVEEVAALLNNAGFTPPLFPPYDDVFGIVIFPSGAGAGALAEVQDMLSVTLTESGGLTATSGYTSTASEFFPGARLLVSFAVQRTGFGVDFASVTPLEEDGGGTTAEAAHWLIRTSEPDPKCEADFNRDDVVDLGDFGVFGAAFDSSLGDPNFDARCDFDNDGDVDLGDFGVFGIQFGRTTEICFS
ncbi:MAG: hypothetical protein Tsb0013_08940 [Phycisphaerales bacterium]